jgi:eukaryotic-like serine/threonine-protein kinase
MPSPAEQDLVAVRYRLVEPLGSGGMGRVWKARDEVLHRDVAIKHVVLPAGLTDAEQEALHEQTLREARAAARISHPNVVQIHDVLRADDQSWIVMEYVPARSLLQVMREDGPLPPGYVAAIGAAVLAALEVAHRSGVLHRDVKPSNVLIATDGRVVLTDFGLASTEEPERAEDPDGEPGAERASGAETESVLGAPEYIAPERAHDGTSSPRADLWSLGATLYAAVEGRTPFARTSPMETLNALATESPAPMRHAGPLAPVLEGLLRKDPATRISAEEAGRMLRRVASGGDPANLRDGRARGIAHVLRGDPGGPSGSSIPARGPAPAGGRAVTAATSSVPPHPVIAERRPSRYNKTTVLAAVLLIVVAGIAAVAVATVGGSKHRSAPPATLPAGSGLAAPGIAAAPHLERPVSPAPSGPRPDEYRLPEGWIWHHDTSGFRIAAPAGWTSTQDDSTVYFREPGGVRMLAVGRWQPATANLVTAWTQEESAATTLPNYQRLRIEAVPAFFRSCADWEYAYEGDGGRLRTVSRGFTTSPGQSYAIVWRTSAFDWQLNLANFWLVTASFRVE